MSPIRIYLIGMPGSGKSAVGKRLAQALDVAFVDLDEEIERAEGMPITQIFKELGEGYFRKVESGILKSWAVRQDPFVMATGGGAPCFHQGIEIINKSGTSIFLDVPPGKLASRIAAEAHRPLIGEKHRDETLVRLMEERRAVYNQAQYLIDAAGSPDEITGTIMKRLESHAQG